MSPFEPVTFGFYDVDSRDDPLATGPPYRFRPRVRHVSENLTRLLDVASTRGLTVGTRCLTLCKGRTARLAIEGGMLGVPMDAAPEAVRELIRARRGEIARVEFERRTCGSPAENQRMRASDVFHVNPAASAAVEALDVDRWVVFGTSLAGCLTMVIEGLLRLGQDVTVAADAVWDVPQVMANYAPPDLFRSIVGDETAADHHMPGFVAAYLERYRQAGAGIRPTAEIVDEAGSNQLPSMFMGHSDLATAEGDR